MNDPNTYNLLVNKNVIVKAKKKKKQKVVISNEEYEKKLRRDNEIYCYSKTSTIESPLSDFDEMYKKYSNTVVLKESCKTLGYKKLSPIQMQTIPVMINRHNLYALAPTGTGKTMAFLLPIIYNFIESIKSENKDAERFPFAVIVSPTIELSKQIYQELLCLLKDFDNKYTKPIVKFVRKREKILKNVDIVIGTPLKLEHLKTENEQISLYKDLKWLVIDESDKMMDDGLNSFSEQIAKLYKKCKTSSELKTALFSATQNNEIWKWVLENFSDDLIYVRVGNKNAAVSTVTQELRYCTNNSTKLNEMQSLFNSGAFKLPCLIFMDQANHAQCLYDILKNIGDKIHVKIDVISGDLSDEKRREAVLKFREGKTHFLICTNLIARGIDFKGVATVVNYDLPRSAQEYIHRIGRCGRAGETGKAVSLWTNQDLALGMPDIVKVMKANNQPVSDALIQNVKKKKIYSKSNNQLEKIKRRYSDGDWDKGKLKKCDKRRKIYLEKSAHRGIALQNKSKLVKELQNKSE